MCVTKEVELFDSVNVAGTDVVKGPMECAIETYYNTQATKLYFNKCGHCGHGELLSKNIYKNGRHNFICMKCGKRTIFSRNSVISRKDVQTEILKIKFNKLVNELAKYDKIKAECIMIESNDKISVNVQFK